MSVRVALLSLVLATPPLSPTADNAAIHDEITAADPTITTSNLAPIERLTAAAELAENRLSAASETKDLAELLTLAVTARRVAYQRTGAAIHLCQLLAAADRVLARADLPATLAAEAADFRDEARTALVAHKDAPCGAAPEPPYEPESPNEPATTRETLVIGPLPAPALVQPRAPSRQRDLTIAGSMLLGVAALVAISVIPVQARRVDAYRELETLIVDVEQAGHRTEAQAQRMSELGAVDAWTAAAKIGLGVSAGVLAAVGGGLLIGGRVRPASPRARVAPYGGPQSAGLTLSGHF